jgi:hypothetical protein
MEQPRAYEDMVDDQSDDSFPASDPPSFTPMISFGQPNPDHQPQGGRSASETGAPDPETIEYEDPVDEQSDESFPASDPPSFTPGADYGRPDGGTTRE